MNGYEYILSKQTAWVTNSGIKLTGSKGKRGRLAYTCELDQNLFQPLLAAVQKSFAAGDGGELGSAKFPGKMQAVHSSSALGVNIFQYWKSINSVPVIAVQCDLCLDDTWADIPNLLRFAGGISPDDHEFFHLHPAQLVKHILGLKRQFGKAGFRLLYLWYDVLGDQGKRHRDEVLKFAEVTKSDGIKFHSLTYQELIIKLANKLRTEHPEYVRYLTQRYL